MFLLARTSPLLEYAPTACGVVTIIGAITTLFAGTIGLVQNDFKSIIAYSTCSQLGYMVTICGLNNYNVGIFHLFNHSFFKALLFLTAGAVIHSLANMQDIRKYGGLQQVLIFSYTTLLIGTLALVGTPFLTGFYSKDVILELAYARYSLSGNFGYLLTIFSVLTTSYYSFRLLFLCFHSYGSNITNCDKQSSSHIHDADMVMVFVLSTLALGSIFAGWFFKPMFIGLGTDFWNNSIAIGQYTGFIEAEFLPVSVKLVPLFATLFGAVIAYLCTMVFVKQSYFYSYSYFRHVFTFLNQRWHYDKVVNTYVALPGYHYGLLFVKVFDKGLLELLPFFGALPQSLKHLYLRLGETQSGLIYHYAAIMIFTALGALTLLSFDNNILFDDARLGIIMATVLLVL